MKYLVLFFPLFLQGLIIQTNQIDELLPYVHSNTWVFFDVDDTLLTSKFQLGRSDYYFLEFAELQRRGVDEDRAHQICRSDWNAMNEKLPACLMDPLMLSVVHKVQQTAAYAIGLTARGPQTNKITHQQLRSVGLDFSISSPGAISVELPSRHLYEKGIWFVELNPKGDSIRQWLESFPKHPSRIVLIDDRRHHLENMERELLGFNIEFIGLHYSKVLENPFNPEIAKIQAEYFPEILSDQEALAKLTETQGF